MKRMIAASAALLLVSVARADEQYLTRGVLRAGVDREGRVHGDFQKQTGLKNLTSISYKLILIEPNGERIVDENKHVFKVGDRFRLLIEADTDVYVYVFHEGPDGVRTILVPDQYDEGRVPKVERDKKGQTVPDDGTYLEVVPPVGTERMLVFATPEKKPELTPKAAFEQQNQQDRTKIELKTAQERAKKQQDEVFKKSQNGIQKSPVAVASVKQIAEKGKEVAAKDLPEFHFRGLDFDLTSGNDTDGKTVAAGSYDEKVKPSVYRQIVLKTAQQ